MVLTQSLYKTLHAVQSILNVYVKLMRLKMNVMLCFPALCMIHNNFFDEIIKNH